MKQNIYKTVMTVLFAVAVFLFFLTIYPFHICHHEQCQMFEYTLHYFVSTLSVPGGFADWLARFLTQFFISVTAGSLIMALLLTGVQIATVLLCKSRTHVAYALSFVAPILLILFFCDGDAMVSAPVAVLCSLLTAKGILSVKNSSSRKITELICVVLLYFLLGSASIIFSVAVVLHERKVWLLAATTSLFFLCIIAAHNFMGYPYFRLFYGVNYYRFHENYSAFVWYSIFALAIVLAIGQKHGDEGKPLSGIICYLVFLALGITGVCFCYDGVKEEYLKYDTLSRRFQWNAILHEAKKDKPSMPYSVAAVNLAIVKTGNLSHMFDYHQIGSEGLLPEYQRDYLLAWTPSESYFQLGMINTCQRHTYEAQELIPDAQKSARAYKRLAETNLLNGHYNVARKYLKSLTHTAFYRRWANGMMEMISSGDSCRLDKGYEYLRSVRLKEKDFLFNHNAMEAMLVYLVHENPANHMALDYLLMWGLLSRNLDGFMKTCPFSSYKIVPKPFQEAYLVSALQSGEAPNGVPEFISQQTMNAFAGFIEAQRSGADERSIAKKFGNTYWFYFFYPAEQ